MKLFENKFIPFIAALAFAVAGCNESQNSTKESAESKSAVNLETPAKVAMPSAANEPAVEGTKTITLANGAVVTWIQDNEGKKFMPRELFSDASDSLYESLNMPAGLPASVSTFLVKTDGKYILFDAGLGAWGGQLLKRLDALKVNPDSIGLVYLTHFHADHIAGLVKSGSAGKMEKVFKNASVYAGKVEYDAWMNDIPKNDLQKNIMALYKDSLHLFVFGDRLPHGVLAMDAVGHTPGHTAFQFSNLLVIGDLMHGYALQKNHPEINSNYDMDKEKSAANRKRIMQYARENKLLMAGMHLPPPGFAK